MLALLSHQSPWVSPVVMVPKKDGSSRFCVDYRPLNDRTVKDPYPLPRTDESLDYMACSAWFSSLDLQSGYWQVAMAPEDKAKIAFTTGRFHHQAIRAMQRPGHI